MNDIALPRTIKLISILFLFIFLSSCSIKFIYNNLDWVLVGMIEDYVTLSDEQETNVDKQVKQFLKWHKGTQLSGYAADLRIMKELMTTDRVMTDADAEKIFSMFMGRWQAMKQNIAPRMADMFLLMTPEQVEKLFVKLQKENKEIDEEFKETTREEKMKNGAEKMLDNFEEWLGSLTEEQKFILAAWPERFKPTHEQRMLFRTGWQAELKLILTGADSRDDKRTRLIDIIAKPEQFQTEQHKELLVYNAKQIKALLLAVDPTVQPEQRKYLAGRLDYLIKNFEELAAEAKESSAN